MEKLPYEELVVLATNKFSLLEQIHISIDSVQIARFEEEALLLQSEIPKDIYGEPVLYQINDSLKTKFKMLFYSLPPDYEQQLMQLRDCQIKNISHYMVMDESLNSFYKLQTICVFLKFK